MSMENGDGKGEIPALTRNHGCGGGRGGDRGGSRDKMRGDRSKPGLPQLSVPTDGTPNL